jgi:hypothetical protein
MSKVIGWRRYYGNPGVPVINTPLIFGDLVVGKDVRVTLFLDNLYVLGVRGLDLYEVAYCRKGEHANYLLADRVPVLFVYPPVESVEDSPSEWYRRNRRVVAELERRYPGLFVAGVGDGVVGDGVVGGGASDGLNFLFFFCWCCSG